MRSSQVFSGGETFIVDIFEFYQDMRERLGNELGAVVFDEQLRRMVEDIALYTFHGDQSKGERVLEAHLKKLYMDTTSSILMARRLYGLFYDTLSIEGPQQLIGRYDYTVNFTSFTIDVTMIHQSHVNQSIPESSDMELDDAWVPEKQRRVAGILN